MKTKIIFDMETGDPDDVLTLALLATHPWADLVAVTVTPGSPDQIGVVRHVLGLVGRQDLLEKGLTIGSFNLDHPKSCVSDWHYKAFGPIPPSVNARQGWDVLVDYWDSDVTLVTGGPLKNVGKYLQMIDERPAWVKDHLWLNGPGTIVLQGGFAGSGVVDDVDQLEKFKGMVTCPTYNLNGDPKSAKAVFASSRLWAKRTLVSKNVCHGVVYDQELHDLAMQVADPHPGLALVRKVMAPYVAEGKTKALHDPLAAMCALDPSIGTWAEVEVYREKGEWGARLSPGSGTMIITKYDRDRFIQALFAVRER